MARKKKDDEPIVEQGFLPDMAPKKNKVVHAAALKYEAARNERMALTKDEKAKKDALLAAMNSEGLTVYEYGDLRVEIDATQKPKLMRTAEDADDGDE